MEGKGGARESKQSLVNFPEGRPRAWLGRGLRDGQSKTAFEPIKRQEVSHLQWGEWGRGRHRRIKERKLKRGHAEHVWGGAR